jgi:hypothetical protein
MITKWEVKAAILLFARSVLEKSHVHHSKKGRAYVEKAHERGIPRGKLVTPEEVADNLNFTGSYWMDAKGNLYESRRGVHFYSIDHLTFGNDSESMIKVMAKHELVRLKILRSEFIVQFAVSLNEQQKRTLFRLRKLIPEGELRWEKSTPVFGDQTKYGMEYRDMVAASRVRGYERHSKRGRLHQVKPYERVADRIPVYRDSDVHKYMAQPRFNDGGVYTVSIGFQQATVWRHKTPSAAGSFVSEYAQQQPGTYGYWQNGSFHRFSQAIEDMHRRKIQESAYTADR